MVCKIHVTRPLSGRFSLAGPPREFAGSGANLLWGPHDIIIFKLDPSQSPN